jgi:hypothetical protein
MQRYDGPGPGQTLAQLRAGMAATLRAARRSPHGATGMLLVLVHGPHPVPDRVWHLAYNLLNHY